MTCLFLTLILFFTPEEPKPPELDTIFVQVSPQLAPLGVFQKSEQQSRAVVLVHGLRPHPISTELPHTAYLHGWQKPDSTLVTTLSGTADIYAFAYSQNVPVEEVAHSFALRFGVRTLKALGYDEIILIGHSAGGLVCRTLVEDFPEEPVTKVLQLCSPNGGSGLAAKATAAVRHPQVPFLKSLTKEQRAERPAKAIPRAVQFACIVANGAGIGDGLVGTGSQWPEDLQKQGIPAFIWFTSHHGIVRTKANAEKLRQMLDQPFPRWNLEEVGAARKKLWWSGNKVEKAKQ